MICCNKNWSGLFSGLLTHSSSMAKSYIILVVFLVVSNFIELESYNAHAVTANHNTFTWGHDKFKENSQPEHYTKSVYNSSKRQDQQQLEWPVVKDGVGASLRDRDFNIHNHSKRKHNKKGDLLSNKKHKRLRKNRRQKLREKTVNNYQQDEEVAQQRIPLITQSKEPPILQTHFMLQQSDKQKNIYRPQKDIVKEKVLTKLRSQNASKTKDFCSVQRTHKTCACVLHQGSMSVRCSGSGEVPKRWNDVTDLPIATLNLENNNLRGISDIDFYGISIHRLLLSHNSISNLKPLAFWGLENSLQILDLAFNKLTRVPSEAIKLLIKLKTLILAGNLIHHVTYHDLGFMKCLEVLTLEHNPLLKIHPSFLTGSTQVKLLSLDSLELQGGMDVIASISQNNIQSLSLNSNQLSNFTASWTTNFTNLRLLHLSNNVFEEIPDDAFKDLKFLTHLDLRKNLLKKVPSPSFEFLPALQSLDLSGNSITNITTRSFASLRNLTFLDLSNNFIKSLEYFAFYGLDNVQTLDLRNNQLYSLEPKMFGWKVIMDKDVINNIEEKDEKNNDMILVDINKDLESFHHLTISKGRIHLESNPWLCNCILEWMRKEMVGRDKISKFINKLQRQHHHYRRRHHSRRFNSLLHHAKRKLAGQAQINWMTSNQYTFYHNDHGYMFESIIADSPTCHRPKQLKDMPLKQVDPSLLSCEHDYYYYEHETILNEEIEERE